MSQAPITQKRLLLCSQQDDSVVASQSAIFSQAGLAVIAAASPAEIHEQIENNAFDIFVLNHTLSFADRKRLARKIKTLRPSSGVNGPAPQRFFGQSVCGSGGGFPDGSTGHVARLSPFGSHVARPQPPKS